MATKGQSKPKSIETETLTDPVIRGRFANDLIEWANGYNRNTRGWEEEKIEYLKAARLELEACLTELESNDTLQK